MKELRHHDKIWDESISTKPLYSRIDWNVELEGVIWQTRKIPFLNPSELVKN
jgi:hypothetical protein